MLMKEKQGKSGGFGSLWCPRTRPRKHAPCTTHTNKRRRSLSFSTSVGVHHSSRGRFKQVSLCDDESLHSYSCTHEAQAAPTSAPRTPWPLLTPSTLPSHDSHITRYISRVVWVTLSLQMLKDSWVCVVKASSALLPGPLYYSLPWQVALTAFLNSV